jgi:tRNA threonylcarbamoyladenosine biosynthesis protein TsaB
VTVDLSAPIRALARELGGALLALDSSAALGSVAAATAERFAERELDASSMPSESLAVALGAALTAVGASPRELAGIVVGLGPGSFTGLRVGLATVKGLAFGLGTPVYGVSSLALIAAGEGPGLIAPILDARRGEVFCALYEVGADGLPVARLEDAARPPATLAPLLAAHAGRLVVVGYGPPAFPELTVAAGVAPSPAPRPRAAVGLLLCADELRERRGEDLSTLSPRYLRVSEAERVRHGVG